MPLVPDIPAALVPTRLALHRLATYVVAPARHVVTGRFGLRAVEGGYGTPPFEGRRIWVQGTTIFDERDGEVRSAPVTSLQAAADFLGTAIDPTTAAEGDSPALGDVDADLGIDPASSDYLGWWFANAFEALTTVRGDDASVDASEPQLWPGHFDPAIEIGDEDHRGSYGASPGDDAIDEPYLYLSLWWPDRLGLDTADPSWNAPSFTGRVLRVSDFPADVDPVTTATTFWRDARDAAALG